MITASAGLCGAVFGLVAEHAGNICSSNIIYSLLYECTLEFIMISVYTMTPCRF